VEDHVATVGHATANIGRLGQVLVTSRGFQHDASPDAALAAVRAHEGPLLVDLDETLYLGQFHRAFHRLRVGRPVGVVVAAGARRLTGGIDRVCAISTFTLEGMPATLVLRSQKLSPF
jgi:hypothetical protein